MTGKATMSITTARKQLWTLATMAVAALVLSVTTPAAATAATPALDPSMEADIRAFFTTFDVNATTQDELIDALEEGEGWDALREGSTPVSTRSQSADGVVWQVNEFEDGSIAAQYVGAETPGQTDGLVQPMGVNDCGYSAGATGYFSNCNIYLWVGAVIMGFRANFHINPSGNDSISSAWGWSYTVGGACSAAIVENRIVKGTESVSGKALASFVVSAVMCGVGYTTTFHSYLWVGGNQATHEFY